MAQKRADWRVGVYVRVHGHLRSFENKKSMVVFSLKVINDFNEVSQKSHMQLMHWQVAVNGTALWAPAHDLAAVSKQLFATHFCHSK